jgi:hypothetical protein
MLFEPALLSVLSGRLGGTIFSHNRHGPYAKAWVQPDETPTTERQAVWDAMTAAAAAWAALSPDQRGAWGTYSQAHPRHNRIGQPHPAGGYQEFTRANVLRFQANNLGVSTAGPLTQVSTPPAQYATQPTRPPLVTYTSGFLAAIANAGQQAQYGTDDQDALLFWSSPARPLTTAHYHGQWTLTVALMNPGTNLDGAFVPITGPVADDECFYLRSRYIDRYGNVHAPWIQRVTVTP